MYRFNQRIYEWIKSIFYVLLLSWIKVPEPVVTYSLPGAPPTESTVVTPGGKKFQRRYLTGTGTHAELNWGAWVGEDKSRWYWHDLLAEFGTLTLLDTRDPTAALYGPPGARWGDPSQPCPYQGCALKLGHVGLHFDRWSTPFIAPPAPPGTNPGWRAGVTREDFETLCTCRHPSNHLPGCPRYGRIKGPDQDIPSPDTDC